MDGGVVAFPDNRQAERGIDVIAIIQGASYMFHVALASPARLGETVGIVIPPMHDEFIVLALLRGEGFAIQLAVIDAEMLNRYGDYRGAEMSVDVPMKEFEKRRITDFRNRL